jgi:GTPase
VAARSARRSTGSIASGPIDGLPVVAIVGRPNVGKSTLFNRVVGERTAIVEDRARTTRDRLYATAEWNDRRFVVIDTGGLEHRPGDAIEEKVQEQARLAISEADVILFLVDAAAGPTPGDQEANDLLRGGSRPVILVVNKADNQRLELEGAEFHRLGWEETYAISAAHGRGTGDLLDAVVWALPPESPSEIERKRREAEIEADVDAFGEEALTWQLSATGSDDADPAEVDARVAAWDAQVAADQARAAEPIRIAFVGRPNVGKSSLLNRLLGEERAIVSEIPGTTRDAIDTALEWNGNAIRLIDTAGLRRRGKVASGAASERYSALRSFRAIERADVAVLLIDAADGLTAQDAHVAGYVVEEGRGLVIAVNKWDLVEDKQKMLKELRETLGERLSQVPGVTLVPLSALSGRGVDKLAKAVLDAYDSWNRRVPTPSLNRWLEEALARHSPPAVSGRRIKLRYITQPSTRPPTFVAFCSRPEDLPKSYIRYLTNSLREAFDLPGVPLRLNLRKGENPYAKHKR